MAVTLQEAGLGALPVSRAPRVTEPRFGEVLSATTGYYTDPLYERLRNVTNYGLVPERGFDWESAVPERHNMFAADYSRAVNAQHAAEITRAIDESIGRRQTMAEASVGQVLLAEVLNPVNLLAIPIGGPVVRAGSVSALRTMGRAGAAAGATGAALNFGLVQPFDPVQNTTESLVNTASYAVFGAAFGGAASIPASTRLAAQQRLREQATLLGNIALRANELGVTDTSTAPLRRAERPLGNVEDVEAINRQYVEQIDLLQRELSIVVSGSREARALQDEIANLQTQRQPYAQEAFARDLEAMGVNTNDIYRPSQGGDNWFLNWVTTPARRILTADYGGANNTAKRVIAEMAYDSGLQLELHRAGATSGLSVYQRAAADLGEFAQANQRLKDLWAEDTAAPAIGSSPLAGVDLNATNVRREVDRVASGITGTSRRQAATQTEWLAEVSRKRLLGEEMTEAQSQAADIINRFFETWEARLIETGQLRTRNTIKAEVDRLGQRVEDLRVLLTQKDTPYNRAALRGAEEDLARSRFELENLPSGYAEPHLPRYWRIEEIRRRRDEFANILKGWFRENPYITRFNEETRSWERIALGTDEDAIARRVDQTIDNILGENQNKDIEEVFVGGGRSTNIQSRSLDIPNSMVVDFIELDPTALMATYARRTAPQYHFRKQFGGKREEVLARVTGSMRANNVPEKAIQEYVRDFDVLYRRVVGRVIENPDTLNQKTAAFLRDMASFTFLGGAGLAAIGDLGRIVMENSMPTLGRSMQSFFDPTIRAINKNELRKSGAALDMLLGSAYLRVMDDQNFNVLSNTRMDKLRNAFYTANLLGPVTTIGKEFAGMNGAHMLIDYSQKLARGEASPTEMAYLARYGIDAETARNISNSAWQTDPNTGLILANTDEWLNTPIMTQPDGTVARINDGEGVEIGGRYQPVVRNEDGSFTVDYDYIERELFPQRSWTEPRQLPQVTNATRRLKDAQRFDERPWTGAPYNLPEDAITSERQWFNFLAARDAYLRTNETFQNRQRSLLSLTNEEIVQQVGREFNVGQIITDPEIVRDVFSRQNQTDLLGFHQYSFARSGGQVEDGVVYLDIAGIRKYWRRVKGKLEDPRASLNEINDQLITGDIDPVAYQHRRALYQNVDQFENANDFAEFILMHELHHGKIAQGRMSVPEYEARIDDAALAYMRERRKARTAASEMANAHALQLSQGGALPEEAFLTPAAYRNFLVQRAILENDPNYSFRTIGLDGRKKNDVFLRDIMLDREARRLSEQAERTSQETVSTFRGALKAHVDNVVMSATAMDRPTIMDGVIYLPERYGKLFGLEADPNVPGYVRIENGFLVLPLQFFGFAMANVNKTVGVMMQGAVRNRLAGVTSMMALGYMISSIRTPDYVWDDMSIQDRLGKSFDMSGVAALYSDLFYTTLQTSLALGGPNITGGFIQPRYPQEPNAVDAITNVTGAASGWTADMVRSAATFASGEYGEGASQFIRNLPFSNLWFIREDVNQLGRYLGN
jgi:hypothetical protein